MSADTDGPPLRSVWLNSRTPSTLLERFEPVR
jgi:hypothetical protein